MEQHYVGTTPWRLGTVKLDIIQEDHYMKFILTEILFGREWNKISFLLTPKEYEERVNKDIGFHILSTGGKNKIIYQVNKFRIDVEDTLITKIHINYDSKQTEDPSFLSEWLGLDQIVITGLKMKVFPQE